MKRISFAILAFLLCALAMAPDKPHEITLLMGHHDVSQLPDEVFDAYATFVKAVETLDKRVIEKHCLPHSVTITTAGRPKETREEGWNINIPYLQSGFSKQIEGFKKESEDTYLIRTASSYMRFVNTRSEGWKLYDYGDRPIE